MDHVSIAFVVGENFILGKICYAKSANTNKFDDNLI
jgi:hypothetical protein